MKDFGISINDWHGVERTAMKEDSGRFFCCLSADLEDGEGPDDALRFCSVPKATRVAYDAHP